MNHLNGNNNQTNKPNISITTNFQFNQSQPPHSAPLQSIQNYLSHYDTDGTTEPMSAAIQNTSAHSLNQNTLSQMTNELQRDLSFQQKDDLGQMIFYPSSYGFNSLKSLTDLPRRKRYKPSNDQVSQLMEFFEKDPLPSTASRIELSSRINMRPRAIQGIIFILHLQLTKF